MSLILDQKSKDAGLSQYRIRRDKNGHFFINESSKHKTLAELVKTLRQPNDKTIPVPLTEPPPIGSLAKSGGENYEPVDVIQEVIYLIIFLF